MKHNFKKTEPEEGIDICTRCKKLISDEDDVGWDEAGFALCEACCKEITRFESWFPSISHR